MGIINKHHALRKASKLRRTAVDKHPVRQHIARFAISVRFVDKISTGEVRQVPAPCLHRL